MARRHRRRSHRRLSGLGEPISLIAIPWLWVAGGALFAKWFATGSLFGGGRPLTDKDMAVAQKFRSLLDRANEVDNLLDPQYATAEQKAIYAAVYANRMASAVGYDFGGEGVLVEAETDANGNIIFVDEIVKTTDSAGNATTYTRQVPKVKSIVKRTGVVEGDMCEVVSLAKQESSYSSAQKGGGLNINVSPATTKMVPCRNLTTPERLLTQEEVVAIARLSANRFDIMRRQAGTLQGRV
jgi:hypothetical protein